MTKRFENIQRKDFIKLQFNLLNAFRPKHIQLTNKEIEVAVEFFVLEAPFSNNRFSSASRNQVVKKLEDQNSGVSNATLNQHIISLQKKGILTREVDNTLIINKSLRNLLDNKTKNYEIKFEFVNVE